MALIIKTKFSYDKIMESLFFGLSGVFVGITLNDLWRLMDLPGNKQQSNYGFIEQDEIYQYMIAFAIASSSIVYQLEKKYLNNILLGLGTAVGVRWANSTEKGLPVEVLPSKI